MTARLPGSSSNDPSKWRKPTLGLHGQPLAPDGTVDVRAYVKRLDDDWNRGAGPARP